jgi:hypothetical protein
MEWVSRALACMGMRLTAEHIFCVGKRCRDCLLNRHMWGKGGTSIAASSSSVVIGDAAHHDRASHNIACTGHVREELARVLASSEERLPYFNFN